MAYPLLFNKQGLKEELIKNKIFVPTYWANIFKICKETSIEYHFAKSILYLPIDQRNNKDDMSVLTNLIKS